MTPSDRLRAQDRQFEKHVAKLSDTVYWAVGYSGSNVGMIIADGALVIIDTTESTEAAANVLAEFRKLSDLPVKAIVYTHGHRDHVSGASVFAEGGEPEIIASARFVSDLGQAAGRPAPITALLARTKRQFGIGLSFPDERISIGIGPGDRPVKGLGAGYLGPTVSIAEERKALMLYGVTLEFIQAPGETTDHMVVWKPDERILFSADNYYHAFPNLYAIRGTRYRDFEAWADSLDLMAEIGADILAPGHTMPVVGAERVRHTLTTYALAIRHVVSASIEGIDKGLSPDELVEVVKLPPELADQPHLHEFYGSVAFAVRAYFAGTLGWFDGNPTSLSPLPPLEEARRVAALAGGEDRLCEAMRSAMRAGEHQWAMQLADRLLRLGSHTGEARTTKRKALLELAEATINAPARNYYLSCAQDLAEG